MLFMVIERFRDDDMVPIYKKVRDSGRMMPEGLTYLDSWVEPNFSRCFQLMECDDLRLFQEWVLQWKASESASRSCRWFQARRLVKSWLLT